MKSGVQWPLMIVGFLGLNVSICGFTIYVALSDTSHKVEANYDYKALHWDESVRQREFNRSLGWSLSITIEPATGGEEAAARTGDSAKATTRIRLADGSGMPIKNARILCEAFHEAVPSRSRNVVFTGSGDGRYDAPLDMDRAGLWRFRFVIDAMGMRFTDEQVVPVIEASEQTG